jgi:hypothetical protein
MNADDIDWGVGRVRHWALDCLDEATPACDQIDELQEDLAQVEFPGALLLDVGWYPEFSADGAIVISVIRSEHWEEPLYREYLDDLKGLRAGLQRAVAALHLVDRDPSRG